MLPSVVSGIKDLRLVKTTQAQFAGFYRDAYRTLEDAYNKALRLDLNSMR